MGFILLKDNEMIIVDNLSSNTIKFIPRNGVPQRIILVDEQTKEEISIDPVFGTDGYYTTAVIDATLVEGRRYKLTIYSSQILEDPAVEEVLYRDLLFVTTQDIDTYSSHDTEYKVPVVSSGTKYKII